MTTHTHTYHSGQSVGRKISGVHVNSKLKHVTWASLPENASDVDLVVQVYYDWLKGWDEILGVITALLTETRPDCFYSQLACEYARFSSCGEI